MTARSYYPGQMRYQGEILFRALMRFHADGSLDDSVLSKSFRRRKNSSMKWQDTFYVEPHRRSEGYFQPAIGISHS
jgi:hypothetical protein